MKNVHFDYHGQELVWHDWLLPLRLHEIGLVISYPGSDVRRRTRQLQSQPAMVKRYLRHKGSLSWRIGDYLRDKWENVAELRMWLGKRESSMVVAIFGLEEMLNDGKDELIREIHDWYRSDNLRILLFCEGNYYDESYEATRLKLIGFSPRVVYHPVYSDLVVREFIGYLLKKWKFKLNEEDVREILLKSGGIMSVVKELTWMKVVGNDLDSFKSLSAISHIKSLWSAIDVDTQRAISYIAHKIPSEQVTYLARKYTEIIGLVAEKKVRSELLETFIKEAVPNPQQVEINAEKITINGTEYTNHFTRAQRLVLTELISVSGKVVSRDQLIDKVWHGEGISDWAFDSHIKRLRDRLEETGVGSNHLITKKKKGLLWQ